MHSDGAHILALWNEDQEGASPHRLQANSWLKDNSWEASMVAAAVAESQVRTW